MTVPVWGTFSVMDHCQSEAFLREVLLFDTLVVPYPRDDEERNRWRAPNPEDASETWDPDRLDQMLEVLGVQAHPGGPGQPADRGSDGHRGARMVRKALWDKNLWDSRYSNAQFADALAGDPFLSTALMVAGLGVVPEAVDAVAAYRSQADWLAGRTPQQDPGADLSAASALVALARPLLLPRNGKDEWGTLKKAVELANDDSYRRLRSAYHDYFRGLIKRLPGDDLDDVHISAQTFEWARDQLNDLWRREREFTRDDRRWSRVEAGVVTTSAVGSVGLAIASALPPIGVGVALLGFAGCAINRWARPSREPTLSGASMFIEAQRSLAWMTPTTPTADR